MLDVTSIFTYTFFTVKYVTQVFLRLGFCADKGEDSFICFVVCTEGHSVKLAVVLHLLEQERELNSDEKLTGMTDLFWGKKQQIENSLEENVIAYWCLTVFSFMFQQLSLSCIVLDGPLPKSIYGLICEIFFIWNILKSHKFSYTALKSISNIRYLHGQWTWLVNCTVNSLLNCKWWSIQ